MINPTMQSISGPDAALPERFNLREERFNHGEYRVSIVLPRAADELLDEEAFAKDERMPYWADLWPSAKALARLLLDQPRPEGRWIELGCGLALPSMALKSRRVEVIATDHNEDALLFARFNAQRNGLGELTTSILDWRDERIELGEFDVAVAADVLYEQRNAIALAALLPRILKPYGVLILADPNRRHLAYFQTLMRQNGWRETQTAELFETQMIPNGEARSLIRILEFVRE